MQSTLTPQEADPHDIFVIEPDVVLAARADQASPDPVHDALSRLAQRAPRVESVAAGASAPPVVATGASTPTVDTTFRAAAVDTIKVPRKAPREPSAMGRWAKNTSIAFLFALCSAVAASTWRYHGDTAKQMIANWLPPFVLASWSPTTTPPPAEQPDTSPAQATAADQASTQPIQPSDGAAPVPASSSAELAPSVQSMARDLATMGQQIEQLKASIEQLKAGQAQTSRELAKATEQNLQPRIAALPPRPGIAVPPPRPGIAALPPSPRPIAAPIRKPKPAFPPAQAAAASTLPPLPSAAPPPAPPQPALSQPLPQPQATVESDGGPVVRPPMPLH
jgi:TolA-binding protein